MTIYYSKSIIDRAEDLLKTYERAMRDFIKQGHCLSAEWRFKNNTEIKSSKSFVMRFQPDVFDIIKDTLLIMANSEREAFSILQVQYAYISPYFKRSSRVILQKNQRLRNNSISWYNKVEQALSIFWSYMQKHKKFNKYFD